uniref:TSA: Wollemia nobilis Ref_Wollemi_Transcript_8250_1211 transcribed RNA sequence n=1 Tax=Wollemia nobilis TaxID=56998 RepID=A0A0C9RWN2_9CONI
MSFATKIVQGSNLAAWKLGRGSACSGRNKAAFSTAAIFNRRSGFIGRADFPAGGLRWGPEKEKKGGVVFASGDGVETTVETPEEILSGEWPENFSMLNYEDLSSYLEPMIFKAEAQPSAFLGDVMSTTIYAARADQLLEEVDHHFEHVSGLPVIDDDLKCIGVISKKDKAKASKGLKSTVGEVMSSPAITLSAEKTVLDAAVLMLKNKIHRIPIVNDKSQVVGMVTRTDIFSALEGLPS